MRPLKAGRILALDYGRRRIGVAISDPLRLSAQALPTLTKQSMEQALQQLQSIVTRNGVEGVVVGMPYTLQGQKGAQAREVEAFIEKLGAQLRIPILTWDERLTTQASHRILHQVGRSPSRHKAVVDQIAAVLILQSYLDRLREQE